MTAQDIITAALRAARVLRGPGRTPSNSELQEGLEWLNESVDEWSARKAFAWNVNFTAFTLIANHQPHTIGPSGADFTAPRPVRIENAALILNTSTPNVDVPLRLRDDDWWANQRVKGITSQVPTDLYYSPDVTKGSIYLWPVPSYAYGLRLEAWVTLGQFAALNSALTAPPAYGVALKLTLAEQMCLNYGTQVPGLAAKAMRARAALQSNNNQSPRIASADHGTGGGGRNGFNWMTGQPV